MAPNQPPPSPGRPKGRPKGPPWASGPQVPQSSKAQSRAFSSGQAPVLKSRQ